MKAGEAVRKSGILFPIFSLGGDYGIGTLGKPAYDFIDFLSDSGQYYWQILPVNPTSYGNSPYQSPCVFAFNPYFIDPDILVSEGLLREKDTAPHKSVNTGKINYSELYKTRLTLLKRAAENVSDEDGEYISFLCENSFWLIDFCAFMALKEENGMLPHEKWNKKISDPKRLSRLGTLHCKIQFLFFKQWIALKKYANAKGVHIIGDLPIYPSRDSSDYYFSKELFLPDIVAACPPDSFSPLGQLWGNPIYNWKEMENSGFSWWKERLSQAAVLFDCVRIDHFRGIYEYYCVKENSSPAIGGKWVAGPGTRFSYMIKETFPALKIIAEDLGFLTEGARNFFKASGFPGMKILQFAFEGGNSEHLPHNYQKNTVAYTGTHDNPTVIQWLREAPRSQINSAADYLGAKSVCVLSDSFIRGVMSSVSDTAIVPLQDWLCIGSDGRINTPGTTESNWEFRIKESLLTHNLSEKIFFYTKLFKRTKE